SEALSRPPVSAMGGRLLELDAVAIALGLRDTAILHCAAPRHLDVEVVGQHGHIQPWGIAAHAAPGGTVNHRKAPRRPDWSLRGQGGGGMVVKVHARIVQAMASASVTTHCTASASARP